MELIPNNGKSIIGNKATTARGTASEIHQQIISRATDNTWFTLGKREKGLHSKNIINTTNPMIIAICFLLFLIYIFICKRVNVFV